jgi:hypothetical protein
MTSKVGRATGRTRGAASAALSRPPLVLLVGSMANAVRESILQRWARRVETRLRPQRRKPALAQLRRHGRGIDPAARRPGECRGEYSRTDQHRTHGAGLSLPIFVAGPAAGRWGTAGSRGECRRDYVENLPSHAGAASAAVVPATLVPPADRVFVTNAGGTPCRRVRLLPGPVSITGPVAQRPSNGFATSRRHTSRAANACGSPLVRAPAARQEVAVRIPPGREVR